MFRNEKHRNLFTQERVKMSEGYRKDKERLSVIFIMTGNEELYQKMKPYYDVERGNFYYVDMFEKEDFSAGLNVLAKLAANLYNYSKSLDPIDLVASLDEENFELAMAAIRFRRNGLPKPYEVGDTHSYI